MIVVRRTTPDDSAFVELARQLSAMLAELNGEADEFYNKFNVLNSIPYVVVVELNGAPVACGGIRPKDDCRIEVKRMYTIPEARGKGAAKAVLTELEQWAKELGFREIILETMDNLQSANRLYAGFGFTKIPNYPPYEDSPLSICYAKQLASV